MGIKINVYKVQIEIQMQITPKTRISYTQFCQDTVIRPIRGRTIGTNNLPLNIKVSVCFLFSPFALAWSCWCRNLDSTSLEGIRVKWLFVSTKIQPWTRDCPWDPFPVFLYNELWSSGYFSLVGESLFMWKDGHFSRFVSFQFSVDAGQGLKLSQ